MRKNKILKYSIIYLFVVIFLFLISLSFLFGAKVGLKREEPYFDKIIKLYVFKNNLKNNLSIFFNNKKAQIVKKENKDLNIKNSISIDNKMLFFSGKIPENFVIATTTSIVSDKIVNHYLIFLLNQKIIHKIDLDESNELSKVDKVFKWPHGLIINENKEVFYNFDGGNSLIKKDLCGNRIWEIEGNFHHLMSINKDYLWALKKSKFGSYEIAEQFLKIDTSNGKIISSFNVQDLINANKPFDYFSIKQRDLSNIWEYEPFHFNDVDVLTGEFSGYFYGYNEGDLLISSRSLNSVFIIDPQTLKVKKYFFGLTRRQHDPDWNKGYITIYDNQTFWGVDQIGNEIRNYNSRIIKINNLDQNKIETINYDTSFSSDARGNNHILETDNTILSLIISPYEGKLLLFDKNKNVFSLINNQKGEIFPFSNGKILDKKKLVQNINLCKK